MQLARQPRPLALPPNVRGCERTREPLGSYACPPEGGTRRLRRRSQRRALGARQVAHAGEAFELADAFATLKSVTSIGAGVGIFAALAWSALPLVGTPPDRPSPELSDDEEDAAGIKWGFMSVVSCLPLFNWLAWIFAAFENEERTGFYYTLAALYALPQLAAGFDQDWLSLLTLAAGVAHVQVERVAEERGISREVRWKPEVGDGPGKATKAISSSARAFADALQKEEQDPAKEELKKWDDLFGAGKDARKEEQERKGRK